MNKKTIIAITFFSVLSALVFLQFIFVGVLQVTSRRIASVISESLNIEMDQADFETAAKLFRNLEKNGLIGCADLALKTIDENIVVYSSFSPSDCEVFPIFLSGVRKEVSLRSNDGRNWTFSFVSKAPLEVLFLIWLSRILFCAAIFSVGFIFYYRSVEDQKIKAQADLHIRGIAHDLMAPLGGLKILVSDPDYLKREAGFSLLKKSTDRVVRISETILEGRSEHLSFAKETFYPDENCKDIVREKQSSLVDKNSSVELSFVDQEMSGSFEVLGNDNKFKRLISNIVNNSIESFESKELKQDVPKVEVYLCSYEKFVGVVIRDNGPGIGKEYLDDLGLKPVLSQKFRGSGIGLFMARQEVEKWGGKFSIHSVLGQGTEVKLEFRKAFT